MEFGVMAWRFSPGVFLGFAGRRPPRWRLMLRGGKRGPHRSHIASIAPAKGRATPDARALLDGQGRM